MDKEMLASVYKIYKLSNKFINLTQDKEVKRIQKQLSEPSDVPFEMDSKRGLYKSILEILCYEKAILKTKRTWRSQFGYLFKLSARYELTDSFVPAKYLDKLEIHDFVFATPKKTYLNGNSLDYPFYYSTVLWCCKFDSEFVLKTVFENCRLGLAGFLKNNLIIDLEHVMYAATRTCRVAELDVLGIKGDISTNGDPMFM
jgi:hypothetical protein